MLGQAADPAQRRFDFVAQGVEIRGGDAGVAGDDLGVGENGVGLFQAEARFAEQLGEFGDRQLRLVHQAVAGEQPAVAAVHQDDGTTNRLYEDLFPEGSNDAALAEEYLLASPRTVSPGCALFRRNDILDGLLVGQIPFSRTRYHGAGPDLLMFLIAVLRHKSFGFVNEVLAHFRAHKDSITVNAMADPGRNQRLSSAYLTVKQYYLVLKWAERTRLPSVLWSLTELRLRAQRRLRALWAGSLGGP